MSVRDVRIFLTGGAGFIGSHLTAALLGQGCQVTVFDDFNDFYSPQRKERNVRAFLDHPRYRLFRGDIRDRQTLTRALGASGCDAVIHLAARAGVRQSLAEPVLYQEVNVTGLQNVLEGCRQYGIGKLLFASSSSVYGGNEQVPFSEDDPVARPLSPYAATKAAGELLCHTYSYLYGMQILCLRFFTVYGPRQRPDMAIHKFARLIDREQPLPMFGDGEQRRDFTYIDDIVAGLLAALAYDDSRYEIFNLGNSATVSLREVIHLLERSLGKTAKLDIRPAQAGDMKFTCADISRAERLLRFAPRVSLPEGIQRFVDWYREEGNCEGL
ncbi:MAG TPA: NAD-dependent epimerase/dehydratase family protein [Patescibacteria group bacterium]|nr:NAD-dependent epimerase/dehydratase family protein [Patescibacteria group bacterium]